MIVANPTETQFTLSMNGTLHNPTMYVPYIYPMNVSLFLEDTEPNVIPFAQVALPGTISGKYTPINITNQVVDILNLDQYTAFNKLVIGSTTFRLAMRGKTRLKDGALHHEINYNKVATLKGKPTIPLTTFFR